MSYLGLTQSIIEMSSSLMLVGFVMSFQSVHHQISLVLSYCEHIVHRCLMRPFEFCY